MSLAFFYRGIITLKNGFVVILPYSLLCGLLLFSSLSEMLENNEHKHTHAQAHTYKGSHRCVPVHTQPLNVFQYQYRGGFQVKDILPLDIRQILLIKIIKEIVWIQEGSLLNTDAASSVYLIRIYILYL